MTMTVENPKYFSLHFYAGKFSHREFTIVGDDGKEYGRGYIRGSGCVGIFLNEATKCYSKEARTEFDFVDFRATFDFLYEYFNYHLNPQENKNEKEVYCH